MALPAGLRLPQDPDDLLGRMMCLLHDGFPFVTRKPSHPQWPSSEGPNQHRAIEIEKDAAAMVSFAERERLTIPADAGPGELAGGVGQFGTEGSFDAPIVWEVQQAPLAIVEVRLREGDISLGFLLETNGGIFKISVGIR